MNKINELFFAKLNNTSEARSVKEKRKKWYNSFRKEKNYNQNMLWSEKVLPDTNIRKYTHPTLFTNSFNSGQDNKCTNICFKYIYL